MLVWLYMHDYPSRSSISKETSLKGERAVSFTAPQTGGNDHPSSPAIKEQFMQVEPCHAAATGASSDDQLEYFDPQSIPLRHLHVYGVADYYQIVDLKQVSQLKFSESLDEVTNAQELKEIIAQVYEYTFSNDLLRHTVTQHAASLRHRLNSDADFLTSVSVIPDFMRDYLVASTQSYENEIAEQMEHMMKERDRISQQLQAEKVRTGNLKIQNTNNQTIVTSLTKRITSLSQICNKLNERHVCASCQSTHPLQVVKPKSKRPSSPRTDEDAWFLACSNCSRRISRAAEVSRGATASPLAPG
ncbi:MAG: hypothetical protein Q9162_006595 [Coniocarpon cinnabarinum]